MERESKVDNTLKGNLIFGIGVMFMIILLLFNACTSKLDLNLNKELKQVVITVDDAPYFPEQTEKILDVFTKHNVEATFFCVGEALLDEPKLATRIAKEHIMANHTYKHLNMFGLYEYYPDQIEILMDRELHKTQELIDSINISNGKATTNYFRPPYGALHDNDKEIISEYYKIIMWDIDVTNWDKQMNTTEYVVNHTLEHLEDKEVPIIAFHLSGANIEGLDILLSHFKDNNVQIISLEERAAVLLR